MRPGDKVRILRELHPNNCDPHIHFGKKATVLSVNGNQVIVSIDDFPNMNHREMKNRFFYWKNELEAKT